MTGTGISDALARACTAFAALKKTLPMDTSVRGVERAAFTHTLWCPTCRPLADQVRSGQAARTGRLAAEARAEGARVAADALDDAAEVIEVNGYFRYYLWDTRQAARGTPLDLCRVDVIGALGIALYDSPVYASAPRVLAVEQFLTEHIDAPSVGAWSSRPGNGRQRALDLLRTTADTLRTPT